MNKVVRAAAIGTALAVSAALVEGSVASAQSNPAVASHKETSLKFDVEFSPFNYTDLGPPGPSAADVIVFHDKLLQSGRQVAEDVGSCVVVEPDGLSNCTGVITFLDQRGSLAFAFRNSPPPRKTLAITGGTGIYRTADGDGLLVEFTTGPTGTLTLRIDS
jgi:hypothetical protein